MSAPLIEVRDLAMTYRDRVGRPVRALDGVSFTVDTGEALGVVGESGCGKSTLGRAMLRLVQPTSGSVLFEGRDILSAPLAALTPFRRAAQMVFQDPFGSLNPRHRVRTLVGEGLAIHGIGSLAERARRVAELLDLVGLPVDSAERYPHAFSGGQRQRIAIARALAVSPRVLVADEPVSALDVSIQSQIINLIASVRRRFGLALVFISHDLSVVRHVADRVAVMYFGRIVELGPTETVFQEPRHPYTQALIQAIPKIGAGPIRPAIRGELPNPADPPAGCAFASRCPLVQPTCRTAPPVLTGSEHRVACFVTGSQIP